MMIKPLLLLLLASPLLSSTASPLVSLKAIAPDIAQELRYATTNNFTKAVVYDFSSCYLRPDVAAALKRVQARARREKLSLKVWDCYRPMKAQERFWELVPDPRYVSPPGKGGRHTRGTAVDLTLIDQKGRELLMPSAFDDFSERAHRRGQGREPLAESNSLKLEGWMTAEGFTGLSTEWWHYDFKDWQNFPPIEVNIRALEAGK